MRDLLARRPLLALLAVPLGLSGLFAAACASSAGAGGAPIEASATDAAAAFDKIARVLRHPRCMNCHTVTDFPRVDDYRAPHPMNVARGSDDGGLPGMRCAGCHPGQNQPLLGIPGAPHWKLAPLSMGWEQLDDQALAEALKDRARNGGRTLEQLFDHMAHDPLVLWAWDRSHGRTLPPHPHDEFVAALRTWIDAGAPSPGPTARSRG